MAPNCNHEIGRKLLFSELFKHNQNNPPVPPSPPPTQNHPIRNESNISNETDNEENQEWDDDFIHELTRQITDSMLKEEDDQNQTSNLDSPKKDSSAFLGSPSAVAGDFQSTVVLPLNRQRRMSRFQKHRRGKNRERFVANNSAVESCQPTYMAVTLQRIDSGSGMTAVFLGKPGLVNGSYGTGVFLPRAVVHPPESSKNISGSSTVLIPTRVMQLLQLHFSDVNIRSHQDSITKDSSNMNSVVEQNQETVLPQEWTY